MKAEQIVELIANPKLPNWWMSRVVGIKENLEAKRLYVYGISVHSGDHYEMHKSEMDHLQGRYDESIVLTSLMTDMPVETWMELLNALTQP